MNVFFWVVLGYLILLMSVSIVKSFAIKSQEDFMVAGRSVPTYKLVATLLCTWIGSGSLLAGAGLAAQVGLSELWMAAGAWIGIILVFFLAGRVRRISQYTVPDILELRYNKWARILGTIVIVIAYTTIVGYQFRGGAFVLELVAGVPQWQGVLLTAAFIILFTAFAGMLSIVSVDIINGTIITFAVLLAVPLVFFNLGGMEYVSTELDPSLFTVFGDHNFLWAMGVFLPTFLLLMGESNMYQKFFSARNETAAKHAVIWWVIGTIVVETAIATLAILAFSHFNSLSPDSLYHLAVENSEQIILHTARFGTEVGIPIAGGLLLICAAVAIITSTGNSFLLAPSTNITRDIYQRFVNPQASEKRIVVFQRITVLVLGVCAYFMLTQFDTILAMAFTAYTMIGAGLTPALLAAFLWKRVTTAGGVASIATGMAVTLLITVLNSVLAEPLLDTAYIVLPSAGASILALIVVSLLTQPDPEEKWRPFYTESGTLEDAIEEQQLK
ncbi:solute:Na+ symporter, SSS family/sodium/proline symporter [Cyclonatronum proteinivorum]|uniref:Solute:Na+ symporter, SSS family/sodium/proline symporter n=1 Tax=Cyclonatronum proteinivorum TaxID=1457365 RepID=A0A345UGJ7_9BACT|nr:sodium:solute symporter family protein [Cyclonatronum proteinivorum]AXI99598.1 solute:Na+ symporter, SSS family/sodium/proline symporter [Cyclonatronum proteinivorum]